MHSCSFDSVNTGDNNNKKDNDNNKKPAYDLSTLSTVRICSVRTPTTEWHVQIIHHYSVRSLSLSTELFGSTNVFDSLCRAPGDMAISATLPWKQKMFEVSDGLGFYVAVSILLLFSEDNAVLVFKKYDLLNSWKRHSVLMFSPK